MIVEFALWLSRAFLKNRISFWDAAVILVVPVLLRHKPVIVSIAIVPALILLGGAVQAFAD